MKPAATASATRTLRNHRRQSLDPFFSALSWRYWLAELNSHLINQTDVLAVPLPETATILYPVLRPSLWAWGQSLKPSAWR
jgi:hypothetical protein